MEATFPAVTAFSLIPEKTGAGLEIRVVLP